MRFDYDTIGKLAGEIGCRRDDLLALAEANDPFYAKVPNRWEAAEWFANLWQQFDFRPGSHLRRIHYILISQTSPLIKPSGVPYLNLQGDWKYLIRASLGARYLRLIPDGALSDHRNDPPIIHADGAAPPYPTLNIYNRMGAGLEFDLAAATVDAPFCYAGGFKSRQDFVVEVWVEKSTQNDILVPLAHKLGFNLIPGAGETSEILARQAVERAIEDGRPMRILYVSDFDPGGRSMPVALARKVEYWLREADLNVDVTLQPIVLTPEQCEQYRLPRIPLKETERRAAKFEQRFGSGSVELDALEALYPGELERIVTEEVTRYIDPTLAMRVKEAESDYQRRVDAIEADVLENYDLEEFQERYDAAFDAFERTVTDIESETEELWPQITRDLEDAVPHYDPDDFPKPRPANPPDEPLFDSGRDYIEQIDHYRKWQGK